MGRDARRLEGQELLQEISASSCDCCDPTAMQSAVEDCCTVPIDPDRVARANPQPDQNPIAALLRMITGSGGRDRGASADREEDQRP